MKTNANELFHSGKKHAAKGQWLVLTAICCAATVTRASLLFGDSFSYNSGNLPGQGGWINSTTGTAIQVQNANLSYSGLPASAGKEVALNGSGANAYHMLSSSVTSGSIYCSFLLQLSGALSASGFDVSFGNGSSPAWRLGFVPISGINPLLGYGVAGQPESSLSLSQGPAYLVVGRYNIVPGANNDSVDLWVNPSSATFGNAGAPTANFSYSNAGIPDPVSSIDRFTFENISANVVVDELRVGTSWADVTADVIPEPPSWSFVAWGILVFLTSSRRRL